MRAHRVSAAVVLVSLTLLAALASHAGSSAAPTPFVQGASMLETGRYLVIIGGCNDCHSQSWDQSGGRLPESKWLTGNEVGFRGPWGTSYPSNLRLFVAHTSEAQWLHRARMGRGYPPMPWTNLRAMSSSDLKAIYAFIRSLGPAGVQAPAYVPPDQEPTSPYIVFEPQQPQPPQIQR